MKGSHYSFLYYLFLCFFGISTLVRADSVVTPSLIKAAQRASTQASMYLATTLPSRPISMLVVT